MPYIIKRFDGLYITSPSYASVLKDGKATAFRQHARHFKTVAGAKSYIRANPAVAGVIFPPTIIKV